MDIVPQEQITDFQFYSRQHLSRMTIKNYSTSVKQYLSFIEKNNLNMGFQSITNWLETFDNSWTYNFKLQGIKAYFLKLYENEPANKLLELEQGFNKIKRRKPKISVDEEKYITFNEYKKLISVDTLLKYMKYCKSKDESSGYTDYNIKCTVLFIQSLFWTGCRISELLNIKIKDCSINHIATIKINNGKGGKDRLAYLQKDIYDQIIKSFNSKVYLFETRKGTKFNRLNVTWSIHRFAKKILNRNISAHTLRHSKAMYLKDDKHFTPDQVAKALGHSSVVTTLQHYFHGTPTAEAQGIC
jgi:integrase/recombinase XerD